MQSKKVSGVSLLSLVVDWSLGGEPGLLGLLVACVDGSGAWRLGLTGC